MRTHCYIGSTRPIIGWISEHLVWNPILMVGCPTIVSNRRSKIPPGVGCGAFAFEKLGAEVLCSSFGFWGKVWFGSFLLYLYLMYLWLGKIPSLIFFHLVHCRRAAQLSPGFRKCHGSVWRHVHDWINPSSPDRSAIVNLAIIVNTIQYIHPRWSQLLLCCLPGWCRLLPLCCQTPQCCQAHWFCQAVESHDNEPMLDLNLI